MIDMTYAEIKSIKKEISSFTDAVKIFSKNNSRELSSNDISFFTFIAKRIIFFKYFIQGIDINSKYFCEVMISDLYYLITDIIQGNWRYVHVNERSIIENYTRLLISVSLEDNHVTVKMIDSLKTRFINDKILEKDFSFIKGEYVNSCNYIHGGELLKDSLVIVFSEIHEKHWNTIKINEYYQKIFKMFKIYEKMLLIEHNSYIDGCFHRKKTLLDYLLGNGTSDSLFLYSSN